MNAFVKGYWNKNLGDDLFLKILCERYPKIDFFTVMTKNNINAFKGINNLHIKKIDFPFLNRVCNSLEGRTRHLIPYSTFSKGLGMIKRTDIAIEIGGSIFMMPPNDVSTGIELKQRKIIRQKAKKYCILGSNFGPFYNNKQVDEYAEFFNSLDDICFRDNYSHELFQSVPTTRVAPDIVLNLQVESVRRKQQGHYVVISVIDPTKKIDFSQKKDSEIVKINTFYKNTISKLIFECEKQDKEVILMSFCDAEGDARYANKIYEDLPTTAQKNVSIYSYEDIDDALSLLQGADAVVASRYHAMILGWLFGKPLFVFSYSDKTSEVIDEFFPNQSLIDLRNIEDENFDFNFCFSTIGKHEIEGMRKSAGYQFNYLDKICK